MQLVQNVYQATGNGNMEKPERAREMHRERERERNATFMQMENGAQISINKYKYNKSF